MLRPKQVVTPAAGPVWAKLGRAWSHCVEPASGPACWDVPARSHAMWQPSGGHGLGWPIAQLGWGSALDVTVHCVVQTVTWGGTGRDCIVPGCAWFGSDKSAG